MSLREALAGGGGVKSIQTGFVRVTPLTAGTGEDVNFINVTISAVTAAKCTVQFDGAADLGGAGYLSGASDLSFVPTARLTSSTNLRIAMRSGTSGTTYTISGRWTVVEYK
jgi:hypothetical protein